MLITDKSFNYANVPALAKKETLWKVKTAFTGANVGDYLIKIDFESLFNTSQNGTNFETYFTYYFNVNQKTQLADEAVSLSNLVMLADNTSSSSGVVSSVNLNVEAIPVQTGTTNKTYANVKSAIIYSQPLLLGATLNLSAVRVNGVDYSLTSPVNVPIPENSKLNNNLVVSNNNIAISIMYTT